MPPADSTVRSAPDRSDAPDPSPHRPSWRKRAGVPGAAPDRPARTRPVRGQETPDRRRRSLVRPLLAALRRTPDQLAALLAATVLCCAGAGVVGALEVAHRQATLDQVITHRGPVLDAARVVYRSLADAHATATVAFLFIAVSSPGGGTDRIAPSVAVPLHDGDRIHLGAWTTLTLHLEGPDDAAC